MSFVGFLTHTFFSESPQFVVMNQVDFLIAFGKRLEQLRKSKELSYRKMSTMCDIDYSDISKIEKGQVNITLSTILELSKALEIEPKVLFDFENIT